MHDRLMWPINGKYRCGKCFREYDVNWAGSARFSSPDSQSGITSVSFAPGGSRAQ